MDSEDYNSGFQTFPLAPSKDESKEQTKEDTKMNFQIYTDTEENVVEAPKEVVKVPQRESPVPEARSSTNTDSREVEEPVKEDVKVAPRQYSFQLPEARDSLKFSVQEVEVAAKEEVKANRRDSLSQETRLPSTVIAKMADKPPREKVKVLTDRKLNRTTSYPKIPRDEVKSPVKELQVTPRVTSIEEIIEEVPHSENEEVKPPTVETRETPNEAPTTTEEEDMWAPPQNFKMRKSKKRFSTRF